MLFAWIKVREGCANHQPHSLAQWQDMIETFGDKSGSRWMTYNIMLSHCALDELHIALLAPTYFSLNGQWAGLGTDLPGKLRSRHPRV